VYHRLGSDGISTREEMREKLHRWLSKDDAQRVKDADAVQQAAFDPWVNARLRSMLLDASADADDKRKFATARALTNAIESRVADVRQATKRTTGYALGVVGRELNLPYQEVREAYELTQLYRKIGRADNEREKTRLRSEYLRRAQKAGFTK